MLTHKKAYVFWTLQAIINDDEYVRQNLKQAVIDLLRMKQYHNWNEQANDYYIRISEREFDKLCFLIEKNTSFDARNLSLHKFLATIENLKEHDNSNI